MKKTLHSVTVLVLLLLTLTISASASDSGQCGDNLYWSYNNGALSITGSGDMWTYRVPVTQQLVSTGESVTSGGAPWYAYCKSVKSVSLPDGMTSIGAYAFNGFIAVTDFTIPESVTSIGSCAFNYCTGLTAIDLPSSVTTIESNTFRTCNALSSVTIFNAFADIGSNAFSGCHNLTIYGYANSTAQTFSAENDFAFVALPGAPAETVVATSTATVTASTVLVDGVQVAFDAYNIADNNYFKLRDVAAVVSGTGKQFEVDWDGDLNAINLVSGSGYTTVGGELVQGDGSAKDFVACTSTIYLNGEAVALTAYTINGNNYFKLRDLGTALDFNVSWDESANAILMDTSVGYTG